MRSAIAARWKRLVAWCGGSHPVARTLAALLAPTVTIISTLLALGIITPFERSGAEALADSQSSTRQAGTSKMRIDDLVTGEQRFEYTAIGAYDFREERGQFLYNFTRMPSGASSAAVEARFFQNAAFFALGEGTTPWLLLNLDSHAEQTRELETECGTGTPDTPVAQLPPVRDPTTILQEMVSRGSVRDLGKERSFGDELHKYAGSLGAPGQAAVTATAWIDGKDLVRRLELESAGRRTTMRFYDFGVPVDTKAPPAGEVVTVALELEDRIARCRARARR